MAVVDQNESDDGLDPIEKRIISGLQRLSVALKHQAWREAGGSGLNPTQGQILSLLSNRKAEGLRLGELAEALGVSAPTASDSVRALVSKGLLQKQRAPDDFRAVLVQLTPEGSALASRVAGWADFMMAAVDVLNPHEQHVVLVSLVKMIRALQQRGQIPISRMCVTCQFFRANVYNDRVNPHHCNLVDAPFGPLQLRVDCPEHQVADPELEKQNWSRFSGENLTVLRGRAKSTGEAPDVGAEPRGDDEAIVPREEP